MPPSPRLSARITSARYLMEMMMISAQNAIDATPSALVSVTVEVLVLERLAERVQRARADVAEDDAERAERQRAHPDRVPVAVVTVPAVAARRVLVVDR